MRNIKRFVPIAKRLFLYAITFSFFSIVAVGQKNSIKGVVLDTTEKKKLHYAIVALVDLKDSTLYQSLRTDEDGSFAINKITAGKYRLMISYPRMADYLEEVVITDTSKKDLGKLPMIMEAILLQEVIVRYVPPVRMKGDTLEYAADSFIVKPGANVQELLKRLPGVQVDRNGKITAQGKEVKKILVDGDEFFSDDPGLVTQYMLANSVDKVQVFDKKSDATEFTGIDDGKRTKTINLKLKDNKKNGYFGKLSAAGGSNDYYNHEAMGALFKGGEKMAVFGMASKIGKNALSYNDLTKYVSQDYERIEDGTGRIMFTNNSNDYESENYYGSGIPSIESGGAHYSNKWKKDREKLFTNYRVKNMDVAGWDSSKSTNVLPGGKFFNNKNNDEHSSASFSQKASGSYTLPVDSFSVVKISLNGNWYNGNNLNTGFQQSENELGFLVNKSKESVSEINNGGNFSAYIGYNRQFRKKGRTFSLSLQKDDSRTRSNKYNYSANTYFEPSSGIFKKSDTLNQLQTQIGDLQSIAAQIKYSDRLSEHFAAAIEYSWKRSDAGNIFSTFNRNDEKYDDKIDTLSNDYHFVSNTHVTGATFSYNQKKVQVTLGSKFYFTEFQQRNNTISQLNKRNFINWAPSANISFQPSQMQQLSFSYQGNTEQPGVEQLQPLRQSSNPLYVQIGNPDLVPSFRHGFSMNYNLYNWAKGYYLYASLSGNFILNPITTKTVIDSNNRTVSQYINLDGLPGYNGYLSYSWEYKKIHLRPSVSTSFNRNGDYSLVNGLKNKNEYFNVNATVGADYDIKELMKINYSVTGSYNIGKSTINSTISKTWSHNHKIGATIYLPLKLELSSNCNLNFQPKNASFNSSITTIQWDASLVKKVLKNDRGLIKFSVNDILNNNTGYSRNASGGGNISESYSLVLRRYWLLGFTWNFLKN